MTNPQEILSKIPGFEPRPQQEEMLKGVEYALLERTSLLVEAGTGVGKTFGYLLPILTHSEKVEYPVILSTATINLQEQLLFKDIPVLLKATGADLTVAMAKGRNHYLSKRRFFEARGQLMEPRHSQQLEKMEKALQEGWDGDLEKLNFQPDSAVWQEVQSTKEDCLGAKCQFYAECCYKKARQALEKAHLIVTNHHLYFMDFFYTGVLPQHNLVVFDEGHRIPEAATKVGTAEVRRTTFSYYLNRIHKKITAKTPFKLVREVLDEEGRIYEELSKRNKTSARFISTEPLQNALIVQKRRIAELSDWLKTVSIHETDRALNDLETQNFEENKTNLAKQVKGISDTLGLFLKEMDEGQPPAPFSKGDEIPLNPPFPKGENKGTSSGLSAHPEPGRRAVSGLPSPVLWYEIEQRRENYSLRATPLNVSEELKPLWEEKTSIVTSATLTSSRNFNYFKKETGISEAKELMLESPFPYEKNALLYIPREMPLLDSPPYQQFVLEQMAELLGYSRGRALLLFTSNFRMKRAYEALLHQVPYPVRVQGEEPKQKLISWFKEEENPVLCATASFWEGVDIPGEQLSLVVIDKIPFLTPDDPVVEARVEQMKERGENWFMAYYVPDAATKLKQGFGRLIRSSADRGVVAILDNRFWTKAYGKEILSSFPKAKVSKEIGEVARFYQETE